MFEFVNPAYDAMLGRGDLVGRPAREIFTGPVNEGVLQALTRVYRTGEPEIAREVPIHHDGGDARAPRERYFNALRAPYRDGRGQIEGVMAFMVEVTDDVLARRRLAEAAAWQERLIGVLGHDLRSPLQTIVLSAQATLLRADMPEHHMKALARIQSAAYRMGDMIGAIVDWTQARLGGGFPLSPRDAELGEICERVIAELQAAHPDRELVLEQRDPCAGTWDPERLAQVVQNLVGNALEHGAPDRPVRVSLAQRGDTVTIEVHNHGPPIPPDAMTRLFEPFQRSAMHASSQKHLGLGLYIVHEIVHAHGGTVEARSSEPEGTAFTVSLPRTG